MKKISAFVYRCLYYIPFVFCISNSFAISKYKFFESPVEGRYDLTLYSAGKIYPAWLEIHHSGTRTLVGQYVGQGGSARPISKINFNNVDRQLFYPASMGYRLRRSGF